MHPYEIVELKVPAGFDRAAPAAINGKGVVAGRAVQDDVTTRAVRWVSAKHPILLSQPHSWTASAAYGLNDLGEIVGQAMVNQQSHAALWTGGSAKLLQQSQRIGSLARAINASGTVVGSCDFTPCRWTNSALEGADGNAFIADPRGQLNAIDSAGRTYGDHHGLAGRWDVAGYAFQLSAKASEAMGANDYALAVGYENTDGWLDARYWSPGGVGALPHPPLEASLACGANNLGQVVGESGFKGALWTGPILTKLEDLIDPTLGWSLGRAVGINDAGMIVGYGQLGGAPAGWLMAPRRNIKRAPPPIFWHILFGVVHDGPGVVIGPRNKPVPVPPWNPLLKHIPAAYRSLIEGLLKQSARGKKRLRQIDRPPRSTRPGARRIRGASG